MTTDRIPARRTGWSIPHLGLWIAGVVLTLTAAGIIIDLCTSREPQTVGRHPDARGPAARRKFIIAHMADEVYYYNHTPKAKAIPDATLIGYDSIEAAEADGLKPSPEAAEVTAEINRIEIKTALMEDLRASFGDGFAALCKLDQEPNYIFLFTDAPDFALRADGIVVGTWPMELHAGASGERVKLEPVWTRRAADGSVWRAANPTAKAIDSGRLAADLAGTRRLAAARKLVGQAHAATGMAAADKLFVASRDLTIYHLNTCPAANESNIADDDLLGFSSVEDVESTGRTPCPRCISAAKRIELYHMTHLMETRHNGISLRLRVTKLYQYLGGPHAITISLGRADLTMAADGAATITWPLTVTDAKHGEGIELSPRWILPPGGDGWRAANAAAKVISDGRLSAELPLESLETVRRLVGLEVVSP